MTNEMIEGLTVGQTVYDVIFGEGKVISITQCSGFWVRFSMLHEEHANYNYKGVLQRVQDGAPDMIEDMVTNRYFFGNVPRTLFFSAPSINEGESQPPYVPQFEPGEQVFIESNITGIGSRWTVDDDTATEIRVHNEKCSQEVTYLKSHFNIYKLVR